LAIVYFSKQILLLLEDLRLYGVTFTPLPYTDRVYVKQMVSCHGNHQASIVGFYSRGSILGVD